MSSYEVVFIPKLTFQSFPYFQEFYLIRVLLVSLIYFIILTICCALLTLE